LFDFILALTCSPLDQVFLILCNTILRIHGCGVVHEFTMILREHICMVCILMLD